MTWQAEIRMKNDKKIVRLDIGLPLSSFTDATEIVAGASLFKGQEGNMSISHVRVVLDDGELCCSHPAIHDPAIIITELDLNRGMGEGKFMDKFKDFLADAKYLLFRDILIHYDM